MLYDQEPKTGVEQGSEETKEESYLFMKETIKTSRKKNLMQAAKMAMGGLVFGVFACCGFFALKPWAESTFYKETAPVSIPEDTELDETEEAAVEETAAPILSAESYEEIMQSMYDIAQEAEKSLVTIQTSQSDILTEEEKTVFSTSGAIVADNGIEFLILADDNICDKSDEWNVTFVDKTQYRASLKQRDKNRGIAIFSVERIDMDVDTRKMIKVAELGNSNAILRGDVIIALGDMFGYDGAVGYGIVSSVEHEVAFADGTCGIIATDIETTTDGSGVLINQSGEIIGLIENGIWEEESRTVNAFAISDLKSVLSLMLNGESVPYIGIYGTTVTEEIAEEQGIPEGLYVTTVEEDSPAMQAGIKVGDIIQSAAGTENINLNNYKTTVLKSEVGSEIKITAQRRGADEYVEVDFTVLVGSKE